MTYISKSRGDRSATIVCVYSCPEHGDFDAEVQRDEKGDAPDEVKCMEWLPQKHPEIVGHNYPTTYCGKWATWTPAPVACRVRRVEVTRGKWGKPERPTFLDTRKLGEGQSDEEFRAERRKVWRDVRMDRDRREFLNK